MWVKWNSSITFRADGNIFLSFFFRAFVFANVAFGADGACLGEIQCAVKP